MRQGARGPVRLFAPALVGGFRRGQEPKRASVEACPRGCHVAGGCPTGAQAQKVRWNRRGSPRSAPVERSFPRRAHPRVARALRLVPQQRRVQGQAHD